MVSIQVPVQLLIEILDCEGHFSIRAVLLSLMIYKWLVYLVKSFECLVSSLCLSHCGLLSLEDRALVS